MQTERAELPVNTDAASVKSRTFLSGLTSRIIWFSPRDMSARSACVPQSGCE